MAMKKCDGCGVPTMGSWGICRTCKSKRFHAHKRIKKEGLIVDQVIPGEGAWWVWDKKGTVLVIGQPTKWAAIQVLAVGGSGDVEVEDDEDED